jgi:hypothetical protein
MRNKKIFSFDEKKDAEEIILNGFPNGAIDSSKMYLVAKYFRQTFDYGAIRLERELVRFCKEQDKNFNPVTDADLLKKWIKSALAYDLRKIDSVTISQKEIDVLKTIEVQRDKKLLFVALLLSKALKHRNTKIKQKDIKTSDKYYIRYSNFLDIIRLSGIKNVTEVDLTKIFYKYQNLFTLYNPRREVIRIEYADKNSENGILIENLERMMEYFDLLFGKNKLTGICSVCGREIIKNSNKQSRCKECSQVIRNNKQKELMRRKRQVSVSI